MREQITTEQYDSWSEEQCAGIEIVDGTVATGIPLAFTYVLDPATMTYRDGEMFTGTVKVSAPFPVEIDLGMI